jgi:predicted N-acetyltransferase YhbS
LSLILAAPVIRRLVAGDLPAALAIQATNYPAFLCEDEVAFASRLTLPAAYCLAAERDGELIGYLLAHGWAAGAPPAVGTLLDGAGVTNQVMFLHDLAVSVKGQGAGVGRSLVEAGFALAARDGIVRAELIAVEGAAGYWRRLGFAEEACPPALAAKVAGYGAEARWMARRLPGIAGDEPLRGA